MQILDDTKLKVIRRDAGKGNVAAQVTLGYVYLKGKGLPRDYSEAFRWFQKAAEQGDAIAQVKLGGLYWRGNGIAKSRGIAAAWFSISIANGYTIWHHRLATYLVKLSLTKQELQEAELFLKLQDKKRSRLTEQPAVSSL